MRALIMILLIGAGQAANAGDWIQDYVAKGGDSNQFYWDRRSKDLIEQTIPSKYSDALLKSLAGPSKPLRASVDGGTTIYACVPKSCEEKGLYYIDASRSKALGAMSSPGFGIKGDLFLLGAESVLAHPSIELQKSLSDWIESESIEVSQFFAINKCNDLLHIREWTIKGEKLTYKLPRHKPTCSNP